MAKQSQQNRLAKNHKNEVMVEQNLTIDDSLLPCASELEKLSGFFLFFSILVLSAFFIINGMAVQGTIFGSSAILAGVIFFIKASTGTRK